MIKICHETPMCMLDQSLEFNDYDYALVHHFEEYPEYFEFFKKSIQDHHRTVILDNSLYELGEAFDPEDYLHWILRLKPTYYIIPDTFWNTAKTISQAREWMERYAVEIPDSVKPIGVAQGSTIEEIKRCYDTLTSMGIDYMAFTFKFAPEMGPSLGINRNLDVELNTTTYQAMLRLLVLAEMDGFVNKNIKHHLLGLQNTFGISSYKGYQWISSIDTSNPIACAIDGIQYNNNGYVGSKPKTTIDSVFDKYISNTTTKHNIMHNIEIFRKLING